MKKMNDFKESSGESLLKIYGNLPRSEWGTLCKRPVEELSDLYSMIEGVFSRTEKEGDAALIEFTLEFDRVKLSELEVSPADKNRAYAKVSPEAKAAIDFARKNIELFHRELKPKNSKVTTAPGVECHREWRPVDKVGLYIPGGRAPLVSTVMMLGIPALVAGCKTRILCSPPNSLGEIAPEILYAANLLGIEKVFKLGGAQAVAAMAIGTKSVPKVDKIFGPGNRFVAAAKAFCSVSSSFAAIDMLAGPSELLVIADEGANPEWIAADLLSQAEHGADSQVVLVSASQALIEQVEKALSLQLPRFPDPAIAKKALAKSFALKVNSEEDAFEFSNLYAPEHLGLAISNAETSFEKVRNAGSVFGGGRCSVVFGDYASGTNHTLPTSGTARFAGGLTTESFMKSVLFQTVSEAGLKSLCEPVSVLARLEGLEAHARASDMRGDSRDR